VQREKKNIQKFAKEQENSFWRQKMRDGSHVVGN
jgi:hypothetical protein